MRAHSITGALLALLAWSAVIALIVSGLYLYKFGDLSQPTLSSDLQDWGLLGDYLGGVLGTYFSFAAFVGVLATIGIQRLQLVQHREQAAIDELQRMLANTSARLDEMLRASPRYLPPALRDRMASANRFMTLSELISGLATYQLFANPPYPEEFLADARASVEHAAPLLSVEFQNLADCLNAYRSHGGNEEIERLYKKRYMMDVCWLDTIDKLSSDIAKAYFQPEILRPHLYPDH